MCDNDNIFDIEVICPVDGESERNEKILNSEDVTNIIDIEQNTDQSTSIQNEVCYHNTKNIQKLKILLNVRL